MSTSDTNAAYSKYGYGQSYAPDQTVDEVPGTAQGAIVVIERRSLIRGCFAASIGPALQQIVLTFGTVREWLEQREGREAALVIFSVPDLENDEEARAEFVLLIDNDDGTPLIVSSDSEAPNAVVDMLQRGARGYVPTTMSLEVWIEALRLVRAGGVFAPVDTLLEQRTLIDTAGRDEEESAALKPESSDLLTTRESTVVNALRRGKANKVIAYELNMCESTVKVHVRNIMKKLGARNRTEVAFIANEMSNNSGSGCV